MTDDPITHRDLYVEIGKISVKIDNVEGKVDNNAEQIIELKQRQDERTGMERAAKWFVGGIAALFASFTTVLFSWFLKGNGQ